jgi:hypothetical protein
MTKVIPARLGRDWVNKIRLSLVGQASIVAMSHTGTAGIRRQVCRCTKQDIATFNQRCSVGTKARLAMTLVFYTGCRRADAVGSDRRTSRTAF